MSSTAQASRTRSTFTRMVQAGAREPAPFEARAEKGHTTGHEAAKSALRQAEALDVDQVAQQQVSGTKLVTPGNASKRRARPWMLKRLALDGRETAIELAEEAVLEASRRGMSTSCARASTRRSRPSTNKASTAIETNPAGDRAAVEIGPQPTRKLD